jgi:L-ribulose-5-phosphate 3-epimerase
MVKSSKIGIMSGRLSEKIDDRIQIFPINSWKEEFEKASKLGFDLIEWIFDIVPNNPIMNKNKIKEIELLTKEFGVGINSVCADYFMEKKLFNVSELEIEKNLEILNELIHNCYFLGIKILEIPFVDISSLKTEEDKKGILKNLSKILPIAEKNHVKLTLETDLDPKSFRDLINLFDHPNIKANYDTGNSTSLGYDVREELKIFGSLIENIHIKDRKLHGGTVPLGTGDTNFKLFFSELKKIDYQGDFIIQGAREEPKITSEETCIKYINFVKKYIDKR